MDGTRLSVATFDNVTVYEESENNNTWVQVGETILTTDLQVDFGTNNVSSIYHLGRDAMVLSENGQLLLRWAVLSQPVQTAPSKMNQIGLIAVFRDVSGEWKLFDHYKDFLTFEVDGFNFNPTISATGDVVTLTLIGEKGTEYEAKEVVSIYDYSLAYKWSLQETFVEPPEKGGLPTSFSGQAVALSHNGGIVAIGAMNRKAADGSYGLVEVYEKDSIGGYRLKGQKLKPSSDIYRFGEFLALSMDGNHMVVFYRQNGQAYLQVFEFEDDKWNTLGKPITEEVRDSVDDLSLSSDGSRVAIAWDCTPRELSCLPFIIFGRLVGVIVSVD
jgi:hypothetical protein